MEAAWACGVGGALLGSILLLARSRYAVAAFIVSLLGLAVSSLNSYILNPLPESMMTGAMTIMNLLIWAVAIALLLYALRIRRGGVLR